MVEEQPSVTYIEIESFRDVVIARRQALEMMLALGFPTPDATKVAVVISELGRNIVLYAETGTITLLPSATNPPEFKLIAQDQGPGISDVELALTEGWSTSGGLGLGLSGSKKLMDEFEIWSVVGVGTRITAIKRFS